MDTSYNPGVYKDTTGHFGYLGKNGNFTPNISRTRARELAKESGFSTTLKGVYIPPEEKPVKVKRERKPYRKLNVRKNILNASRGDILHEVPESEFYKTYMAYLMSAKNNPTEVKDTYVYAHTEEGTVVFIRW